MRDEDDDVSPSVKSFMERGERVGSFSRYDPLRFTPDDGAEPDDVDTIAPPWGRVSDLGHGP